MRDEAVVGPTLYDVIGVAPGVTAAELRRAYVDRARRLHPDRFVDASEDERSRAQLGMQELNEAWRVLGHPDRRRHYDQSIGLGVPATAGSGRAAGPAAGADEFDDDDEPFHGAPSADLLAWLVRVLPWALLLAVLAAIFIITAYAGRAS